MIDACLCPRLWEAEHGVRGFLKVASGSFSVDCFVLDTGNRLLSRLSERVPAVQDGSLLAGCTVGALPLARRMLAVGERP